MNKLTHFIPNCVRACFVVTMASYSAVGLFAQVPPNKPVPKGQIPVKPMAVKPPSAPAPTKPGIVTVKPSPKAVVAATPVDKMIEMINLKMPNAAIVKAFPKTELTPDDLIRLRKAGASDDLLTQLVSGPASAPPVTSVTTAVAPAPATQAPAPAVSAFNSDLSGLKCETPGLRKRIVAIKNFDFGTVKTADQAILDTQSKIGVGMTALATKRIQEAAKFRVVERENIQAVLAEQDFGASSRAKKGSQARIGKVLGADAILLGTITVFGRDDKKKSLGGLGGVPGVGALGGIRVKWGEDKAVVAITYKLVDAETSEAIATGEARGESKRKGKGIDLGGAGGGVFAGGSFDMTSSNFAQTIIGEAVIDCMDKLMTILNDNEQKVPRRHIDLDTRVAEINGPQIYISSGSSDGVQKCDKFEVSRIVKEIRDPVTKELLDLQLDKVGDLVVTEAREKIAIGLFNGTAPPAIGYAVRKIEPPDPSAPSGDRVASTVQAAR